MFFYFPSTLGESNLTHLTTYVMFSGQRFAILAMFLWVFNHFEYFFCVFVTYMDLLGVWYWEKSRTFGGKKFQLKIMLMQSN